MSTLDHTRLTSTIHAALNNHLDRAIDRSSPAPDAEQQRLIARGRAQICAEIYLALTHRDLHLDQLPDRATVGLQRLADTAPTQVDGPLPGPRCDDIGDHLVARALFHHIREHQSHTSGRASEAMIHYGAAQEAEQHIRRFYTRRFDAGTNQRFATAFHEVLEEARELTEPRRLYTEAIRRALETET